MVDFFESSSLKALKYLQFKGNLNFELIPWQKSLKYHLNISSTHTQNRMNADQSMLIHTDKYL